jgi:uncharacterized phage-associated protein
MNRDEESVIRHPKSDDLATVSSGGTLLSDGGANLDPTRRTEAENLVQGAAIAPTRGYVAPMGKTTTPNAIFEFIDARRPGLKPGKKQLLLFFCQGHHLAWFDDPLFAEPLYATDRGAAVDIPAGPAEHIAGERLANTIGYVLDRYSALSPADLRTLVQASEPWRLARKNADELRIEWVWLRDWFRRPDETDDPDDERPNRAERAEAEAYLAARGRR